MSPLLKGGTQRQNMDPYKGFKICPKISLFFTHNYVDARFCIFCVGIYLCRKRTVNGETFRKKNIFQLYKKKWEEL